MLVGERALGGEGEGVDVAVTKDSFRVLEAPFFENGISGELVHSSDGLVCRDWPDLTDSSWTQRAFVLRELDLTLHKVIL